MTTETVSPINEARTILRQRIPYAWPLLEKAGIKYTVSPERMLFLAYGLSHGVPYRVIEPTARPLYESMGYMETPFIKNLAALTTYLGKATTPDEIKAWMAVLESSERAAKRARHEAASEAARKARALKFRFTPPTQGHTYQPGVTEGEYNPRGMAPLMVTR